MPEVDKQVRAGSWKSPGCAAGARALGLGLLCWEAAVAQLHLGGICPEALQETRGDANTAGRASFLMTFVKSGMPPRLPAHDQCMLSHDISACSAT